MKINNINPEFMLYAWNHQKLVHGALKTAKIVPNSYLYEDLFSEGLLIYAQNINKYQEKSQIEIDKLSFQKILWYCYDQLKHHYLTNNLFDTLDKADNISTNSFDKTTIMAMREAVETLPKLQQVIFHEHMLKQIQLTELSKRLKVSRKTLSKHKKRLLETLRSI